MNQKHIVWEKRTIFASKVALNKVQQVQVPPIWTVLNDISSVDYTE